MFCPKCGRDCGDAKFCPDCGQELSAEQTAIEPPVGRYEAVDGYIDVSYYTMTIHKEIDSQEVDHVIDYRHIVEVGFSLAKGGVNGYLSIREETDQLLPVENEWDAVCDEKTLRFETYKNQGFCILYTFLNHCKTIAQAQIKEKREMRFCCPKCKSRNISVRYMLVPVVVRMENQYVCRSCGHLWTAK